MINVEKICAGIESLISTIRIPIPEIPAALIACSAINRPGISPMLMASEIIRRQPEAGAPFGPLPSGRPNVAEAMERIRCEVIANAIKRDLKVQTVIKPGDIAIQNVDGTIGTNIGFIKATGIAM